MRKNKRVHSWLAFAIMACCLSAFAAAPNFDYRKTGMALQIASDTVTDGVRTVDLSFADVPDIDGSSHRTAAYRVLPAGGTSRHAAILFVHWLDDSPDANRTQFLAQAKELAPLGVESFLIETMWSDPKWFEGRKPAEDLANSVLQVKRLRRALDVLLTSRDIDRSRVAYVGHDFGAMFGAVLAGNDRRVHAWALQAGTTSFSDWYLFAPKQESAAREAFVAKLSALDPVRFIGRAAPAPVLLQFGRTDRYVSVAKAQSFFDAAAEPKTLRWYDAGHALNADAISDRMQWLRTQLKIQ